MKKKNRLALETALNEYLQAAREAQIALNISMYPEDHPGERPDNEAFSRELIKTDVLAEVVRQVLDDER